jgi:hypothetical protein
MTAVEHDQLSQAVGTVLGLVIGATLRAAALYLDHGLSDEPPDPRERRAILDELQGVASVLRVVDSHRELLERVTGELDPAPTIAVLRAVQDSLILALATDSSARAQRIGRDELRARLQAEPVRGFLHPHSS